MAISTGTALALGGSALLSSVLGGLFGSSSQSEANRMNVQMARETNQLNYDMFQRSLAFQQQMWNKTNQWNSPQHQVQMLQQAGINPGAVFGNGSTADATPMSSPSLPSLATPHVDPVDYSWIPNSIDMGVNAYFNNQILNNQVVKGHSDAQIAKVQAEFDAQTLEYRCLKVMNDADASSFAKEQAKITLDVLAQTKRDTISQAQWSTKIMSQEYEKAINSIHESKLRQDAQRIANEYSPRMNEANLKQYQASVAQMYASAREHDSAAVLNHARKAIVVLEEKGVRLTNEEKESAMDALVDKAWNEADESYWNAQSAKKTFSSGYIGRAFGENAWDTPASDRSPREGRVDQVFGKRQAKTHHVRDYSRKRQGGVR